VARRGPRYAYRGRWGVPLVHISEQQIEVLVEPAHISINSPANAKVTGPNNVTINQAPPYNNHCTCKLTY
jgi:hypothetical protein